MIFQRNAKERKYAKKKKRQIKRERESTWKKERVEVVSTGNIN